MGTMPNHHPPPPPQVKRRSLVSATVLASLLLHVIVGTTENGGCPALPEYGDDPLCPASDPGISHPTEDDPEPASGCNPRSFQSWSPRFELAPSHSTSFGKEYVAPFGAVWGSRGFAVGMSDAILNGPNQQYEQISAQAAYAKANSTMFVVGSKSRTVLDRAGHPRYAGDGVAEIFRTSGTCGKPEIVKTLELPAENRAGAAHDRSAFFGYSVAMAAQAWPVVVGTLANAAFVYDTADSMNPWGQVTVLEPPEGDQPYQCRGECKQFGHTVAVSGDGNTIVVADPYATVCTPVSPEAQSDYSMGPSATDPSRSYMESLCASVSGAYGGLNGDGGAVYSPTKGCCYPEAGRVWVYVSSPDSSPDGGSKPDGLFRPRRTEVFEIHPRLSSVYNLTADTLGKGDFRDTSKNGKAFLPNDDVPKPRAYEHFGFSMDISYDGTVLAVGSNAGPDQHGSAFVFTRYTDSADSNVPGKHVWSGATELNATSAGGIGETVCRHPDAALGEEGSKGLQGIVCDSVSDGVTSVRPGDLFGYSVAVSGDASTAKDVPWSGTSDADTFAWDGHALFNGADAPMYPGLGSVVVGSPGARSRKAVEAANSAWIEAGNSRYSVDQSRPSGPPEGAVYVFHSAISTPTQKYGWGLGNASRLQPSQLQLSYHPDYATSDAPMTTNALGAEALSAVQAKWTKFGSTEQTNQGQCTDCGLGFLLYGSQVSINHNATRLVASSDSLSFVQELRGPDIDMDASQVTNEKFATRRTGNVLATPHAQLLRGARGGRAAVAKMNSAGTVVVAGSFIGEQIHPMVYTEEKIVPPRVEPHVFICRFGGWDDKRKECTSAATIPNRPGAPTTIFVALAILLLTFIF